MRIDGTWRPIPVETCNTEDGYYCNLASKGCSNRTGPCHPFGFEGNFACTSEGVFPDPYDCQKYHMCHLVGHSHISENIECGADRAFSAATGDCSLTLTDSVCNEAQYNCSNAGDSHSWPGNLNIFYVCKARYERGARILYPTLYRCSPGEIFNGRDCVVKHHHQHAGNNNGTVGGDSDDMKPFACKTSGLFADPRNCQSYYYCDALSRWKRYTCPSRTHFDDKVKSCMRGTC